MVASIVGLAPSAAATFRHRAAPTSQPLGVDVHVAERGVAEFGVAENVAGEILGKDDAARADHGNLDHGMSVGNQGKSREIRT